MAHSLILLSSLGINKSKYQKILESIFIYFSKELSIQGVNISYLLSALMNFENMKEIVIIAKDENHSELRKILKNLKTSYNPNMILAFCLKKDLEKNSSIIPIFQNKELKEDLTVYVCKNKICSLPINNWKDLEKIIN